MINILICEDDPVSSQVNKAYIRALSKKFKVKIDLYVVNEGSQISDKWFDIAFLDIDLGNENGIDIARKILQKNTGAAIIFITSHGEYALDACKLQCFGYILKPIKQEELEKLYAKAIIQVQSIKNRSIEEQLSFYAERRPISIKQQEIVYIERAQRKINIITMGKVYCVNDSLHAIADKLTNYFLQISQGVIVNAREIQSLEGDMVYMKTGQRFKIGRAFRTAKDIYLNLVK